jgi:hypothetical protein
MEESQQEATEKEVERILGYLQQYHNQDRESYPRTVHTLGKQ